MEFKLLHGRDPQKRPSFGNLSREEIDMFMAYGGFQVAKTVPWRAGKLEHSKEHQGGIKPIGTTPKNSTSIQQTHPNGIKSLPSKESKNRVETQHPSHSSKIPNGIPSTILPSDTSTKVNCDLGNETNKFSNGNLSINKPVLDDNGPKAHQTTSPELNSATPRNISNVNNVSPSIKYNGVNLPVSHLPAIKPNGVNIPSKELSSIKSKVVNIPTREMSSNNFNGVNYFQSHQKTPNILNSTVESNTTNTSKISSRDSSLKIKTNNLPNNSHSSRNSPNSSNGSIRTLSPKSPSPLVFNEKKELNDLQSGSNRSTSPPKSPMVSTEQKQNNRHQNETDSSVSSSFSTSENLSSTPTVKQPQRSWADILKTSPENPQKGATAASNSSVNKHINQNKQPKSIVSSANGKPKVEALSDVLLNFQPTFSNRLLQPRGLVNNGNTCFMNAILQPLSHCPPFYNLLIRIGNEVAHSFNSKTPLVDSLIEFMREFREAKIDGLDEDFGEPFVPEYGRQEDAEEFLGFLLDGLHEELLAVKNIQSIIAFKGPDSRDTAGHKNIPGESTHSNVSKPTNDGWYEVGPKNKATSARLESPISRIFGGQVRSVLKCPGSLDSVTYQPFSSLQLDIQPDDVRTVEGALMKMIEPEIVHDYYSKKGAMVEAHKRLYLDILPPILILHLKRFVYDNVGGTQKLHKTVGYSTLLNIQSEIITQNKKQRSPITYQLIGVVYHHGKSATGGHYTCDILRQNNQWLHVDDTTITPITAEDVVVTENSTNATDRLAYLLFYMKI
ncbi:2683_t:CDS:10 [Ambispora gerdemannii]|uniref:Ubiquitin carboxyl-terminal hydrolase n=1 Tax=Ambispora gerdemannii TaxID=144530 RepID=A0A9N9D8N1_9GLOM|nr:2683_t:CDS:10 [Ambispora gerdemannii]